MASRATPEGWFTVPGREWADDATGGSSRRDSMGRVCRMLWSTTLNVRSGPSTRTAADATAMLRPMSSARDDVRPQPVRRSPQSLRLLLLQAATVLVCGVLPALTLVSMFAVGHGDGSFADDFHHEIYPQAEVMLDGRDPYPSPDWDPTVAPNFIWPPTVAFSHAPLTLLPLGAADVVMVVLGLVGFAAAAVARRRPRLAGLRRHRALAPGRRGDAGLAPDPAPLRARGARVAYAARALRSGRGGRSSGGDEVLRVAARALARSPGGRSRRRCSQSVSAAPPCFSCRRSPRWTSTSASSSSSDVDSTRTRTRSSG